MPNGIQSGMETRDPAIIFTIYYLLVAYFKYSVPAGIPSTGMLAGFYLSTRAKTHTHMWVATGMHAGKTPDTRGYTRANLYLHSRCSFSSCRLVRPQPIC
jgi:hypothetical protein